MTASPFDKFLKKQSFNTRDEAFPFQDLKVEHFLPALKAAIDQGRSHLEKIKQEPDVADFSVIEKLEEATLAFELVNSVYFNLFGAHGDEALQALAQEISAQSAAFGNEIILDDVLFRKVKKVWEARQTLPLSEEQKQLLKKNYQAFEKNGALLNPEQKNQLKALDQELAKLSPQFSENVLKATNAFQLVIENKSDLAGLPDGAIEAAEMEAKKKNLKGWLFTLQAPSLVPFLQYAHNRDLRKKMWMAFNTKAFQDQFDNQMIVKRIVELRHQRAQLLGFNTHADYVLTDRMAESPTTVMKFLDRLLVPSKKAAERDLEELRYFRKQTEGHDEIMPWDFAYLSEKLKEKKYQFNEESLRPYFKLENVISGVFEHARRLFGLTFVEVFDVPKYQEDVRVFEVKEEVTNRYVGLLYTDFFPRDTKKAGAWMTSYRQQHREKGVNRRPHVSIVCNFSKPTSSKPSLLTFDEVQTLFHEFGHALHGLLSDVTYMSLSGTNVYWDFVELPSQIMENWTQEKEGLDVFARHYQTGEPIPADLVAKIKRSAQFQAGYRSLRQLNFAFLDMAWHTANPQTIDSVEKFELHATQNTQVLPRIPGTNSSTSFSHIFAGGYSAGYYSYKWAEVLDADAFEYFKEQGLFNREIGQKFKKLLSRGGTAHPMDLYKEFRGREPDPNALLRRDGLVGA